MAVVKDYGFEWHTVCITKGSFGGRTWEVNFVIFPIFRNFRPGGFLDPVRGRTTLKPKGIWA